MADDYIFFFLTTFTSNNGSFYILFLTKAVFCKSFEVNFATWSALKLSIMNKNMAQNELGFLKKVMWNIKGIRYSAGVFRSPAYLTPS